ncbi:MAG: S8 family serine peptidase [Bdellovibrionales bacterium]|nr:S8 family serine peptidase [Bdellovibrionales bacterium]
MVKGPRLEVLALADLDQVQRVEQVLFVEPFVLPIRQEDRANNEEPAYTGFETGTRISQFEAAWSRGFDGRGQKVAVSDTGLDMGTVRTLHPDFSAVRKGYKFGLFARDWRDPQGHGTHVAGSVGGNGAASEGRLSGGAYASEVIPQGMWSPVLNNLTVPPDLSDMFQPAYNDGGRIHSNSWGSPRDLGAYTGMSQQVDQFMWDNPEYLILFAAGNSGVDNDKDGRIDEGSVSSPGTAKNALTVGASENYLLEGGVQRPLGDLMGGEPWGTEPLASDTLSNNENGLAAFSSRGPTRDGRLKPELVAPGTNIVSVCSRVEDATKLWGNYNEDYCFAGGTSMSTPISAGGAAVARQFLADEMQMSSPSAALVKAVLMHSAQNLFPGQYGDRGKSTGQELLVDGPNMHQGFGRLNMEAATNKEAFYELVDERQGLATGERFSRTVQLDESKPLRVTLVYTDAPANPSASRTLVNNLDLKVIMNGQELMADSRINNHEQIVLSSLSGEVTVEVIGTNVPMGRNGKQPFSLVIGR